MKKILFVGFLVATILFVQLIIDTTSVVHAAGSGGNHDIFAPPDSGVFEELNPLKGGGLAGTLNSPGAIVSRILLFAFPLAGLILFVMIVWGGFEMIMGATSKGMEAGRQRVTAAIVGFILLFSSYWIMQIIQYVFGMVIL